MKNLLILGAGTAGTLLANKLQHRLARDEWTITVVDRSALHYYQPGFLFLPFGLYQPEQVVRPARELLLPGVQLRLGEVKQIEPAHNQVQLSDGTQLAYNTDRSGSWDVWRIPADGAGPNDQKAEQITSDDLEDWFPHFSPDGKWMLFLSFAKGVKTHNDKLPGTQLRMMPAPGARPEKTPQIQVLTTFFGGQGTINVNSWSPDSTRFAYVIYEPLPPVQ